MVALVKNPRYLSADRLTITHGELYHIWDLELITIG
jgi:hypothetical protein